jgi:hypothetical protein
MGTRTPFERVSLQVAAPMEDGQLHIITADTAETFQVLPFVQVMPSPKTESDACYFYNRLDNKTGDARYISYHYAGDPEQNISNEHLLSTIKTITQR